MQAQLIATRENPATWTFEDGKKKRQIDERVAGQYLYRKQNGGLVFANAPWHEDSKALNIQEFRGLRLKNPVGFEHCKPPKPAKKKTKQGAGKPKKHRKKSKAA